MSFKQLLENVLNESQVTKRPYGNSYTGNKGYHYNVAHAVSKLVDSKDGLQGLDFHHKGIKLATYNPHNRTLIHHETGDSYSIPGKTKAERSEHIAGLVTSFASKHSRGDELSHQDLTTAARYKF